MTELAIDPNLKHIDKTRVDYSRGIIEDHHWKEFGLIPNVETAANCTYWGEREANDHEVILFSVLGHIETVNLPYINHISMHACIHSQSADRKNTDTAVKVRTVVLVDLDIDR